MFKAIYVLTMLGESWETKEEKNLKEKLKKSKEEKPTDFEEIEDYLVKDLFDKFLEENKELKEKNGEVEIKKEKKNLKTKHTKQMKNWEEYEEYQEMDETFSSGMFNIESRIDILEKEEKDVEYYKEFEKIQKMKKRRDESKEDFEERQFKAKKKLVEGYGFKEYEEFVEVKKMKKEEDESEKEFADRKWEAQKALLKKYNPEAVEQIEKIEAKEREIDEIKLKKFKEEQKKIPRLLGIARNNFIDAGRIDVAFGKDIPEMMRYIRKMSERGMDITKVRPEVWQNKYAVAAVTFPQLLTFFAKGGMEATFNFKMTMAENPELYYQSMTLKEWREEGKKLGYKEEDWPVFYEKGEPQDRYPTWSNIPGLTAKAIQSGLDVDPVRHVENIHRNTKLRYRANSEKHLGKWGVLKKLTVEDITHWDGGCFKPELKEMYKKGWEFDNFGILWQLDEKGKGKRTGKTYQDVLEKQLKKKLTQKEVIKKIKKMLDESCAFMLVTRHLTASQIGSRDVPKSLFNVAKPQLQRLMVRFKDYFDETETIQRIEEMADYLDIQTKYKTTQHEKELKNRLIDKEIEEYPEYLKKLEKDSKNKLNKLKKQGKTKEETKPVEKTIKDVEEKEEKTEKYLKDFKDFKEKVEKKLRKNGKKDEEIQKELEKEEKEWKKAKTHEKEINKIKEYLKGDKEYKFTKILKDDPHYEKLVNSMTFEEKLLAVAIKDKVKDKMKQNPQRTRRNAEQMIIQEILAEKQGKKSKSTTMKPGVKYKV